jgi:hypothetical protein
MDIIRLFISKIVYSTQSRRPIAATDRYSCSFGADLPDDTLMYVEKICAAFRAIGVDFVWCYNWWMEHFA